MYIFKIAMEADPQESDNLPAFLFVPYIGYHNYIGYQNRYV